MVYLTESELLTLYNIIKISKFDFKSNPYDYNYGFFVKRTLGFRSSIFHQKGHDLYRLICKICGEDIVGGKTNCLSEKAKLKMHRHGKIHLKEYKNIINFL